MRTGRLVGAALAAAPALWLTSLFYWRYWAHRDCIAAAMSSCFVVYPDGSEDSLTSGGFVWGIFSLPFWALAAWLLLGARRP